MKSITSLVKNLETSMTCNAKEQLDNAITHIATHISKISHEFTMISGKKTLSEKEIANAIKTAFDDESFLEFAGNSVKKYTESTEKGHRYRKADITFRPPVVEKIIRNFHSEHITDNCTVFLASYLEQIVVFIIEKSKEIASSSIPPHIRLTINDLELSIKSSKKLANIWEKCGLQFIGKTNNDEKSLITKTSFEKLIRDIVSSENGPDKISKDVFTILQFYIEQYIVDFLKDANSATKHRGKTKLTTADIDFICSLRKIKIGTEPKKRSPARNENGQIIF